jgi:hypothetical protein
MLMLTQTLTLTMTMTLMPGLTSLTAAKFF